MSPGLRRFEDRSIPAGGQSAGATGKGRPNEGNDSVDVEVFQPSERRRMQV